MAKLSSRELTFRLMSLFLGVAATLIVLFASVRENSFINVFEHKTHDGWMSLRGDLPERDDILIVGITSEDLRNIGKWPWPFFITAEFLNALASHQPKAIILDIIFSEPEEGLLSDISAEELQDVASARIMREHYRQSHEALRDAIKNAGNIYLAAYLDLASRDINWESDRGGMESMPSFSDDQLIGSDAMDWGEKLLEIPEGNHYVLPLEDFRKGAAGVGFINAQPDWDGITRNTQLLGRVGDSLYPSLDLVVLADYLDVPLSDIQVTLGEEIFIPCASKPYRIPITDTGAMRVNFKGSNAYMNTAISVTEFLMAHGGEHPPFSADIVHDKIILVGMVAEGGTDLRAVPVNPYYPLVALHANFIDNVLSQSYVKVMPGWLRIVLLLLTGFFIGWILPQVRPLSGFGISILFFIGTLVLPYFALSSFLYWIPTVQPALTVVLAFILIVFYHFLVERLQRRHIQEVFGRCVDREVVDRIVNSGMEPQLGGERAQVTVMFADISNFTPYSEQRNAEEVVGKLNEYFTAMTEIIFHHQGTVDKYMGDAIMVFYGNPIPLEDHALRSVKTAIEMQDRMKELQAEWGAAGFSQSIGINTGEVVVGWMGAPSKKEYTVIGDTVNTAFRIEGVAGAGQILISEATYNIVSEVIDARPMPPMKLKGKSEPIAIYQVIGLRESNMASKSVEEENP